MNRAAAIKCFHDYTGRYAPDNPLIRHKIVHTLHVAELSERIARSLGLDDDDVDFGDKAKVPSSISDFERKNYSAIEAMFVSAGFTNIKCVPLNDLTVGVLKKPGMVDSITINGREVRSGGKKFPKDAAVIISYHSLSR